MLLIFGIAVFGMALYHAMRKKTSPLSTFTLSLLLIENEVVDQPCGTDPDRDCEKRARNGRLDWLESGCVDESDVVDTHFGLSGKDLPGSGDERGGVALARSHK